LHRSDSPKVDLDFVAELVDSGKTIFIDDKRMIHLRGLSDKGVDISSSSSQESVALNIGKDSIDQKERFIGMNQDLTSMYEALRLYNFKNIRNSTEP